MFRSLSRLLVRFWQRQVSSQLVALLSAVWIVGIAVAGLALWLFAHVAEEVVEQETQAFDRSILLEIAKFHSPWLDRLAFAVTFIGDPGVLIVLSLAVGAVLLSRRRWSEALVLAVATGGAVGLNVWLKTLFARARPALWERSVDVKYYSFPSGHAMVSFVVYGLLGYWLAVRFPAQRSLILAGTVLLIGAIGLSRLYFGVHWPTDIIGGYAAGTVWLVTCLLTLEIAWKHTAARNSRSPRTSGR